MLVHKLLQTCTSESSKS